MGRIFRGLMKAVLLALLPAAMTGCVSAIPSPASSSGLLILPTQEPVSQTPAAFGPRISFEHITLGSPASQNDVSEIYQDSIGFLWFGTRDGLIRYDGYEFIPFRTDLLDRSSLSSNIVQAILEDRGGNLWIGTENGLNRYDRSDGRFIRYFHNPNDDTSLSHNNITSLQMDAAGNLWIATRGGGLDMFDPVKEEFNHHRSNPGVPGSVSSDFLDTILISKNGDLYAGGGNGLDRMDISTGSFTHIALGSGRDVSLGGEITSLAEDPTGHLWIGTSGKGVYRLDQQSGYVTGFSHNPDLSSTISGNAILSVFVDLAGNTWVGTRNGLNLFQPDSNSFLHYQPDPQNPNSISNPDVSTIFQDRSGAYWLGIGGGRAERFFASPQKFHQVFSDPAVEKPLSADPVTAIYRDQAGNFWLGTYQGLNRAINPQGGFIQYHADSETPGSLPGENIGSILMDRSSHLWVGTDRGLVEFNPATETFLRPGSSLALREDPSSREIQRLAQANITTMIRDREGWIWVGTRRDGVMRFNPESEELVIFSPADKLHHLSGWHVLTLAEDKDGFIWVGTQDQGLNRIDLKNGITEDFVSYADDPNWLIEGAVTAVKTDTLGIVWVGTNSGLYRFNPADRRVSRTSVSSAVLGILLDRSGRLWVSTSHGIYRYDPENDTSHLFTSANGLRGDVFNLGAVFQDSLGQMYFGGQDGLTYFKPEDIQNNPYLPPVVLTRLEEEGREPLSGEEAGRIREIQLEWPNTSFGFTYAGLSYIFPDQNQYAYKLEGFDRDWTETGTDRSGRYTNLPGGDYVLRIMAANNDGAWNTSGISIPVRVVPPVWQTAAFRWGLVFAIAAVIAGGLRLRTRSITRRNEFLERQVAERTREIELRRKVAEGLRDVINLINTNRPLAESLDFILQQVGRTFPYGKVFLVEHTSENRLEFLDQPGEAGSPNNTPQMPSTRRQTVRDEVLPWLADLVHANAARVVAGLPVFEGAREETVAGFAAEHTTAAFMPVVPEGGVFGGFLILLPHDHPPSAEEMELLSIFADQTSLAIGNERLRTRAEESAVLAERTRLARELHDAVTQTLFSASLIAEALPSTWQADRKEGKNLLHELRQLNRSALAEMRSLLMELRPSAILESRLGDLLHQLGEAVAGRSGITMNMQIEDPCRLPDEVHIALYRISQETLSNIVKHSQANQVDLSLRCRQVRTSQYRVLLIIRDNGVGFNPRVRKTGHFGLMNLRERASAVGARLRVKSKPGEGTTIQVDWQGSVEGKHG